MRLAVCSGGVGGRRDVRNRLTATTMYDCKNGRDFPNARAECRNCCVCVHREAFANVPVHERTAPPEFTLVIGIPTAKDECTLGIHILPPTLKRISVHKTFN